MYKYLNSDVIQDKGPLRGTAVKLKAVFFRVEVRCNDLGRVYPPSLATRTFETRLPGRCRGSGSGGMGRRICAWTSRWVGGEATLLSMVRRRL